MDSMRMEMWYNYTEAFLTTVGCVILASTFVTCTPSIHSRSKSLQEHCPTNQLPRSPRPSTLQLRANKKHVVKTPDASFMYPPGLNSQENSRDRRDKVMESKTHFLNFHAV
jgi:hypothetical protein